MIGHRINPKICMPSNPDLVLVSVSWQRWTIWLLMAALIVSIIYACSFIDRDSGPPSRRRK